jgi:diacylglycerol kinase family enzyme
MRIGVITNLKAGRGARDSERVLAMLEAYPDITSVVTDRSTNVRDVVADLAAKEIDLLVVNGGDGTLQRTLTEVLEDRAFERTPVIAPLRSGRTNSSARDLGIHKSPVLAMDRIIDLSRRDDLGANLVRRDVLRITLDADGAARDVHCGMFCGFGVIDRAIRRTHERFPEGRAQGAFGGAMMAAGLLSSLALGRRDPLLEPDAMSLRFDDEEATSGDYQLVISSTLEHAFLKLKPFWGQGPGAVRITAIEAGAPKMARSISRIVRALPPSAEGEVSGYTSRNVDQVEIAAGCGLTIDGELFPPREGRTVRLEALPNISFVRG